MKKKRGKKQGRKEAKRKKKKYRSEKKKKIKRRAAVQWRGEWVRVSWETIGGTWFSNSQTALTTSRLYISVQLE